MRGSVIVTGLMGAAGSLGSIAVDMPPDQERLRMGILAAQDGVDADEVLLPLQRFQIVGNRQ